MKLAQIENSSYFVSDTGRFFNGNRELKLVVSHKGYLIAHFNIEKKKRTSPVHRLVAKAFIPNPHNKPEVNHIDGDKTNNHVSNLEWVTSKENKRHAMEVLGSGYGERASRAILTNVDVIAICEMIQDGYRTNDISEKLNIDREKIRTIKKGGAWRHISCNYTFPTGLSDHGMSDSTFLWICHKLEEGVKAVDIIKMYTGKCKLSPQTVSYIKRRKTRPELSKDFNF